MSNIDKDSLDLILRKIWEHICVNGYTGAYKGLDEIFAERKKNLYNLVKALRNATTEEQKYLYTRQIKDVLTMTYEDTKARKLPVNGFFYISNDIYKKFPMAKKCYDNFVGVATIYEGITLLTYNIYEVFLEFLDEWGVLDIDGSILFGILADLFFPEDKKFFMGMSREYQKQYMKNLFGDGRYTSWYRTWKKDDFIKKFHLDVVGTGIAPKENLDLIIDVKGEVKGSKLASNYSLLSNLNFEDVLKLQDSKIRNMLWNGVNILSTGAKVDSPQNDITLIKDEVSADGIHTKVYVSHSGAEKFYLIHVYNAGFSHIFELNQL